ncbi:Transmembrane emp24 domain-containing protein 10 [Bonamia ostreae]|uniref:Transmembrane emp24 domain-containing protein 10 n=1 Tax=Bonamia ostreae TaxID=126728 RepID=A0ABV2AJ68_9EUKA
MMLSQIIFVFLSLFQIVLNLDLVLWGKNPRTCISEHFKKDQDIDIEYATINAAQFDKGDLYFTVTDPKRYPIYANVNIVGGFKSTAEQKGDYQFCFSATSLSSKNSNKQMEITIEILQEDIVVKKELEKFAKEEKEMAPIIRELKAIEQKIDRAYFDMRKLRQSMISINSYNNSANFRVKLLGIVSVLVLCALSFLQLRFLRRFFRKKKII